MKIKVSRQELNECLTNVMKRIIEEGKDKKNHGFEKASKKANREIERDVFGDGFKSYNKPHKTNKDYSRKGKNKWSYGELDEDTQISLEDKPLIKRNYDGVELDRFVDYVTVKTDIDEVEKDILNDIANTFDDSEVEQDYVDGHIAFNITKNKDLIQKFVDFLNKKDVNIID